jgi:hypothetical protein
MSINLKTMDSNRPLRLDFVMLVPWHEGQWIGILVLSDAAEKTDRHFLIETRESSVHFWTPDWRSKGRQCVEALFQLFRRRTRQPESMSWRAWRLSVKPAMM